MQHVKYRLCPKKRATSRDDNFVKS